MSKTDPSNKPIIRGAKWLIPLLLLVVAGVYGWRTLGHYTGGLPEEPVAQTQAERPRPEGERRFEPPSEAERRARFEQMMDQVNFSPEQRAQAEQVWQSTPEGREGMRERMQRINEIATPEQQAQMRQAMAGHIAQRMQERLAEARESMSPEEYRVLEKRLMQRIQDFAEGRMGPGGRPGGDGGRNP